MKESNVAEGVLEIADHYADAKRRAAGARRPGVLGRPGWRRPAHRPRQAAAERHRPCTRRRWRGAAMPAPSERSPIKSGREQVLGDGPKQSGGRRIEVPSTGAFPKRCSSSPTSSARSTPSPTCCPTASSPTSASPSAASARESRCAGRRRFLIGKREKSREAFSLLPCHAASSGPT